ncbi:MAG TPA: type II toxin-antitoxin system VapC family toxin [Gammaproteobacteria bacterium]|nr:type II toxin-antitoxin system VapC family toxin [Gammaproteobacteria bacterium]
MRLIIDASVALKWFIPEALNDKADDVLKSTHHLFAPDFLLIELANVFWKKNIRNEMTVSESQDALFEMTHGPLEYFSTDGVLLMQALTIAQKIKHPVYDCIYLALAIQQAGVIVSADQKFYTQLLQTEWKDKVIALENFS